jgi:hypothetical protein
MQTDAKRDYGKCRLWGAISWGIANVVFLGPLLDHTGPWIMIVGFNMSAVVLLLIILRMLPSLKSSTAVQHGKNSVVVRTESGHEKAYTEFDRDSSCHKVVMFDNHRSSSASQPCAEEGGGPDADVSLNCIGVQNYVNVEPTDGDQVPAKQPSECHKVLQALDSESDFNSINVKSNDMCMGKASCVVVDVAERDKSDMHKGDRKDANSAHTHKQSHSSVPQPVSSPPACSHRTVAAIYSRCTGLVAGLVKVWAILWADGLASLTFFITLYVICIGTALVRLEITLLTIYMDDNACDPQ